MDLMRAMKISSTGLSAHRAKMNVIAENLANVETTRTEAGGPYQRQMVVFNQKEDRQFRDVLDRHKTGDAGVEVAEIVSSPEDFHQVHNPNHPDADPETGYVNMPNVNILTEMADMMVARRAFEANATAINTTKNMMLKALEIGK